MSQVGDGDNYANTLELTAPTGGVTKGLIYLIEDSYFAATETADATASFVGRKGPVWVTKLGGTGLSLSKGEKVYWASASKKVTPASTGNVLIATCLKDAEATATKVLVYIHDLPVSAT